ncbi:DNA replication protein DnaC [Hydrogenivirga caldilitoris]|uniref:DNA replication protein DnaC n=1 Tax=Hydrogenivirga caldilitoris TaxID=246264 RepID=A0A497XST5_9AQUI|nr:ATP-binding protein [Hydrogenivirga caldilitoris]RLJ71364.1 DNA replication protein DnaC [Hydrogenivirga caldilitoris]
MEEKCSICGGTGFVKEKGGVKPCECRFSGEDINRVLGIPKRFWGAELENYEYETPSENEAYKEAYIFASSFNPEEGYGLTLIGPPGVGKTHLAVGVLKKIYREKGIKGAFFDTKDLIYKLKSLMDEGKTNRAIKVILNKPLIVLDDLGSERLSEWQRELISYIISYRYNNLKSTIITTNFSLSGEEKKNKKVKKGSEDEDSPKALMSERLGHSAVSRIYEMTRVVYIQGRDRRRV